MAREKRVAMMPPENGQKMLQLEERINGELQTYLRHHADKQEAELICRANMTLYNMAQCRGISLWKLCFEVMPQWEASEPKIDTMQQDGNVTMNIDYDLHLVPIVIDWEHGPSYWEKKYRDLKERVAGLLEDKNPEPLNNAVAACAVSAEDIKEATDRVITLARGHHILNADGTITDVSDNPKYKCKK